MEKRKKKKKREKKKIILFLIGHELRANKIRVYLIRSLHITKGEKETEHIIHTTYIYMYL